MVTIKPFRALRPRPELASRVCELPYDVMSSEEARTIAAGNPLSFLRVSKPEIDLPVGTDVYSPEVYEKGRENFRKLINEGALRQDAQACYYLYQQTMKGRSQCGLVAGASCEDYLKNIVKKHEFTRPDKEDDRVRHIETLDAQTGPVFLVHKATAALHALLDPLKNAAPDTDFTAPDGVRHTAWRISDPGLISKISAAFAQLPALYIADGHHRSAAAARVFERRMGAGETGQFLTVIFPSDQVRILPYNRAVKDLNGLSPAQAADRLLEVLEPVQEGVSTPSSKGELCVYLVGKWQKMRFRSQASAGSTSTFDRLDVELLQRLVLAPIFGIDDPRKSDRVRFVGGIRGTAELEKLVNSGQCACAFSMFPTGIEELMQISDQGGIMPPKSTWFEPKLRDAMFCHILS